MADPQSNESVPATVTYGVMVPRKSWVEYLTLHSDIFSSDYIGYWAYGERPVIPDGDLDRTRWLVFENEGVPSMATRSGAQACLARYDAAKAAALAAREPVKSPDEFLPNGVFLLDAEAAIRAYTLGCAKWGADWFDRKGDALTYDVVIQLALLLEVRYG